MKYCIKFIRQHRIFIATWAVCFFAVALVDGVIYFNYYHRPNMPLASQKFSFEYGELVQLPESSLLQTDDEAIKKTIYLNTESLKSEKHDYPEVGRYFVDVSYTQKREVQTKQIEINIYDTKSPEFITYPKKPLNYMIGDERPDYSKHFKAKDLSKFTVGFDDSKVNYKKPGKYSLVAIAKDIYGNSARTTAIIQVKKPTPIVQTVGSYQSNYSSPSADAMVGLKYVKGILIANKKFALPSSYAPGENPEAVQALRNMIADMRKDGLDISDSYSGYRSYSHQSALYWGYVASYGQAQADTFSARPGHSEHQTGLTFDLQHSSSGLVRGDRESLWVASNAHKYGFIIRYPAGKEAITGYIHEPWHIRYVGKNHALAIYRAGLTLEEYLGVPGGGYN